MRDGQKKRKADPPRKLRGSQLKDKITVKIESPKKKRSAHSLAVKPLDVPKRYTNTYVLTNFSKSSTIPWACREILERDPQFHSVEEIEEAMDKKISRMKFRLAELELLSSRRPQM